MKDSPDFTYSVDSLFYRLKPENKAAIATWNQIHEVFPDCVIPFPEWPAVLQQLNDAGYVVRKVLRPVRVDTDDLLKKLSD
jgi:hypothetical protein